MKNKKTIIVHLDAFEINPTLVEYGLAIAQQLELPLHFHSVQYAPVPGMAESPGRAAYVASELPDRIEDKAEKIMENLMLKVKKQWSQTTYSCDLEFVASSPAEKTRVLLEHAQNQDPHLIILEKENDYSWWNEVFGTAETNVAKKAPCPVMILPRQENYYRISRIMYLMDRNMLEAGELPDLARLCDFGAAFDATIAAAYFAEEGEELSKKELDLKMARIRDMAPYQKFFYYQFVSDNTAEEITSLAEISHTDLLAFPFKDVSFFRRLFDHDNMRTLILKSTVPMLVF